MRMQVYVQKEKKQYCMKPYNFSLTTIGDCCIDIYPDHKKVFLGGTAFNVAYHAKRVGFDASIISLVGHDSSGDLFLQKARERSEERRVGKECRSRWSPYH